ncbi:hypothetical protein ACGFZJ_42060 [Streptomyces sp. NPDC048253]|uniref:hypothetical protein n=1 Tax=Streptomyces sp. NPDC048253 TaxID=3365524 RepID=UPI0037225036
MHRRDGRQQPGGLPPRAADLPALRLRSALDTAEAGQVHEITVVAYYQERLCDDPKVSSLKAETTFDGGSTWHPATTKATGKNTFTTTVRNPRRDQAAKGVGLRISATGSQGNTVRQTLPAAYTLR